MSLKLFEKSHESEFLKTLKKEERKFFFKKEIWEDNIQLFKYILIIGLVVIIFIPFVLILTSNPPDFENDSNYEDFNDFFDDWIILTTVPMLYFCILFPFLIFYNGVKDFFLFQKTFFKRFQFGTTYYTRIIKKNSSLLFLPFSRFKTIKFRIINLISKILIIAMIVMLIPTFIDFRSFDISIIDLLLYFFAIPLMVLIVFNIVFLIINAIKILDQKIVKIIYGVFLTFLILSYVSFQYLSNTIFYTIIKNIWITIFTRIQYLTAYIMWWEGNVIIRLLVFGIFLLSCNILTKTNIFLFSKINSFGFKDPEQMKVKFKTVEFTKGKTQDFLQYNYKTFWKTGSKVLINARILKIKRLARQFAIPFLFITLFILYIIFKTDDLFYLMCLNQFFVIYFIVIVLISKSQEKVNQGLKIEFLKILPEPPKKIYRNLLKSDIIYILFFWLILILPVIITILLTIFISSISNEILYLLSIFSMIIGVSLLITISILFFFNLDFIRGMKRFYEKGTFKRYPFLPVFPIFTILTIINLILFPILLGCIADWDGNLTYFSGIYIFIFFIIFPFLTILTLKYVVKKAFCGLKFKSFDKSRIIPFLVLIFYIFIFFIPVSYNNITEYSAEIDKSDLPDENLYIVDNHEIWDDEIGTIYNNIIIKNNGILEIRNCTFTLQKNVSSIGFFVLDGGKLFIENSTLKTRTSGNKDYNFEVYGQMNIYNSLFEYLSCLEIYSDEVIIFNTTFESFQKCGVLIGESSPTIKNCRIRNYGKPGIKIINGNPKIKSCEILQNDIGILILENSEPIILDCEIYYNNIGVFAQNSNPILKNNFIRYNWDFGLMTIDSKPKLENNVIKYNRKVDYEDDSKFNMIDYITQ